MKKLPVAVLAFLLFHSHVVLAQSLTDCGGGIFFDSDRTGVFEIYVVESDGSGVRQRAILVSFQHDQLLTKCNIFSGQISNDIELPSEPSVAYLYEKQHHKTLVWK